MALKTFNPTTPSRRQLVIVDRSELWKGKPVKALDRGLAQPGRAQQHRPHHRALARRRPQAALPHRRFQAHASSTCRRRSSGSNTIPTAPPSSRSSATRTASWPTSWRRSGSSAGDTVVSGERVDVKPGNAMPLRNMPVGTIVHNVEMKPGKGGQIARSAGTYVQLVGRDQGYALLRLARAKCAWCAPNAGRRSARSRTPTSRTSSIGKAGRNRWLGRRPSVRGVAMNPIDHPHGGGEGRTSGGRHPVTPWGKPTKGKKTRHNKATDRLIVRRRRRR